jgi:hypothetical protein
MGIRAGFPNIRFDDRFSGPLASTVVPTRPRSVIYTAAYLGTIWWQERMAISGTYICSPSKRTDERITCTVGDT